GPARGHGPPVATARPTHARWSDLAPRFRARLRTSAPLSRERRWPPREGLEEGDDGGDLLVGEVQPELMGPHLLHGLREGRDGAVVEVGGGLGHVAQARDLEHVPILRRLRHVEASTIRAGARRRARPRLLRPQGLERAPAEVRAQVTALTPRAHELQKSPLLRLTQSARLPTQVVVPGPGRHEPPQEGADRLRGGGEPDRLAGEGAAEPLSVLVDGLEATHELRLARQREAPRADGVHLDGLLDDADAAVPELREVPGGVVHGGRVAEWLLPAVPARALATVRPPAFERMTGVAGGLLPLTHALVEEELASQGDLLRRGRVVEGIHLRRQRREDR